jgi:hypothetical protein
MTTPAQQIRANSPVGDLTAATRIVKRTSRTRLVGTAAANPQDYVEDGSIRRIGGPTSANFSPVRSTITQLSGSVHFPNTRGVASGLTAGVSFVVGFDIGANS